MSDRPRTSPPTNDELAGTRSILFVCMGNICRSPLAEGIFLHMLATDGISDDFVIDSCGTGDWHVGKLADPRSRDVATQHRIDLVTRARQVDPATDFDDFALILPMDRDNLDHLRSLGAPESSLRLMRSFDQSLRTDPSRAPDVPDPYWGGEGGFVEVYEMLHRSCKGLLRLVR